VNISYWGRFVTSSHVLFLKDRLFDCLQFESNARHELQCVIAIQLHFTKKYLTDKHVRILWHFNKKCIPAFVRKHSAVFPHKCWDALFVKIYPYLKNLAKKKGVPIFALRWLYR